VNVSVLLLTLASPDESSLVSKPIIYFSMQTCDRVDITDSNTLPDLK
jgi:hypothetical protein